MTEVQVAHEIALSCRAVMKLVARKVIGMTGDIGKRAKDSELEVVEGLVVVQGGAKGLDRRVAEATRILGAGLRRRDRAQFRSMYVEPHLAHGLWLETYPADWDNRPRHMAGPERNQRMLDQGAAHLIAFFAHGRRFGLDERGGTNDMVRRAVGAGVPVDIYVADERTWRKP